MDLTHVPVKLGPVTDTLRLSAHDYARLADAVAAGSRVLTLHAMPPLDLTAAMGWLTAPTTKRLPRFNVVLLDDDLHSYDYVIDMLQALFAHPRRKGYRMAERVDADGRAVVLTTHKELAELKAAQIVGYGADPRLPNSKRGMRAVVEPVPE